MVAGVVSASRLSFENDITKFDGSEPQILQAEERFHRVWGGEDQPAVLVVPGGSMDEALVRNRLVYRDAVAVVGEEGFSSLSAIWLSLRSSRWREILALILLLNA